MTLQDSPPLFETFTASRKLFLHFRFLANSFVAALTSYVYDTAIGGTFDAFLHTLTPPGPDALTEPRHTTASADVFSLAEQHSKVMDDILSACLLRSTQKAVGDLLRGVLEVILEFGILMGDLRDERMQEYEAAAPLEDLFAAFKRRMLSLVRLVLLRCSMRILTSMACAAQGSERNDRQVCLAVRCCLRGHTLPGHDWLAARRCSEIT